MTGSQSGLKRNELLSDKMISLRFGYPQLI